MANDLTIAASNLFFKSSSSNEIIEGSTDWIGCAKAPNSNETQYKSCRITLTSNQKLSQISVKLEGIRQPFQYHYARRFYYEIKSTSSDNFYVGNINTTFFQNNTQWFNSIGTNDSSQNGGEVSEAVERMWINLYGDHKDYDESQSEYDEHNSYWATPRISTANFTIDITSDINNTVQTDNNNNYIYYLYIYGLKAQNLDVYYWGNTSQTWGTFPDNGAIAISTTSFTITGEPAEPEFDPQLDIFNTNYILTEYIKPGNNNNQNFRGLYARLKTYEANQDQETASIIFPTKYSTGNIITAANHNDILQSIKTLANSIAYNKPGLTYPTNASTFNTSANYTDATERQKCWNFVKNTAITQNNIIYDLEPYYVVINCIGWSNLSSS